MTQSPVVPAQQAAAEAFQATTDMQQNLQRILVDLIDLALVGKQAHWNIVGPNFRDLHLQLDEVVAAAQGFVDEVAERMRALDVVPDGRAVTVAQTSELAEFPNGEVLTTDAVDRITSALYTVAAATRQVHDAVDAEDPTTADLLHSIIERIEQLAWMVGAENRTPKA
ncbi:Dps family protein [Naumannella halotolerans]|uniref:Starvation-inducible DNA-binding protein n=1 Tax=Naumannella halotolerans TaxID=993414 RepID=A0A4R7JAM1_9ACTN|nr:DNA starvation/stationary phase protection protein [Naumannella halotolerans]TDT34394.1 starvation-inducible DNA-binding protein [Naumannella halotolerans]